MANSIHPVRTWILLEGYVDSPTSPQTQKSHAYFKPAPRALLDGSAGFARLVNDDASIIRPASKALLIM